MQHLRIVLIVLFYLIGCGGGSDSDECNNSVACIQPDPDSIVDSSQLFGTYDVGYTLASNECTGSSPAQQLNENYEATSGTGYHGAPTIDLLSDTGLNYVTYSTDGNTDGTSFLYATEIGSQELTNFLPNKRCVESVSLYFSKLGTTDATAQRTSSIDCADIGDPIIQGSTNNCAVIYSGKITFAP